MDFTTTGTAIVCTYEKTPITMSGTKVSVGDFVIDFPGEYEKSGVLVEATEFDNTLIYTLQMGKVRVAYIENLTLETTEKLVSFLGDIDVLVVPGKKEAKKMLENIEAKIVMPYGEETPALFASLAQSPEPLKKYKPKEVDLMGDITHYILLEK